MLIGWIFFSVAAGMFAHIHRNRHGGGWFFVAIFFSPLVAFVLLFILRPLPERQPPDYYVIGHQPPSNKLVDNMKRVLPSIIIIALLIMVCVAAANAQQQHQNQQVFRNELGQTTGTAQRSGNQTTYRDAGGRTIGTGTTDSSGVTVFRDSRGRNVGNITDYGRR
jgi:branched-subunit amino acid transport protein AzlD